MLRAGKRITITADLKSEHGFILAPVIDVMGIILRADNPIPEAIKSFLAEKGAIIKRIRYQGEMHVKIQGQWSLTPQEAKAFIEANSALAAQQLENIARVPAAHEITAEVIAHIADVLDTQGRVQGSCQRECNGHSTEVRLNKTFPVKCHKGAEPLNAVELTSKGFIVGDDTLPITAHSFHQTGSLALITGLFNSTSAAQVVDIHATTTLTNTLVQAGRTVSFSGNSLNLTLNPAIDFLNRPHQDCAIDATTEAAQVPQNRPT